MSPLLILLLSLYLYTGMAFVIEVVSGWEAKKVLVAPLIVVAITILTLLTIVVALVFYGFDAFFKSKSKEPIYVR